MLASHVSSMVNINDASRQPNQDAASLLYNDKDCPPTQVDEDGDEHEDGDDDEDAMSSPMKAIT